MEFIWNMTEENWKNLMHDMSERIYDRLLGGFYGQLFVGDYCIEFLVLDDDDYKHVLYEGTYNECRRFGKMWNWSYLGYDLQLEIE